MPIQFVWDVRYEVGHPDIDRQHRELFDLANALPEELTPVAGGKVIMALFRHINSHFALEEEKMRMIGYPKLVEHQEQHNALIEKLDKACGEPLDTDESVFFFKKFVYDWVIEHIMFQDRGYFRYVQEKRGLGGFWTHGLIF